MLPGVAILRGRLRAAAIVNLLDAALSYAEHGIAVLPLHWPVAKGACSCGCRHPHCWQRAKHPLVNDDAASTDAADIRAWWARWPRANVGIAAAASGLVTIDLDLRPGGEDLFRAFLRRWGEAADDTVVAITGKGYHLYYQRPPDGRAVFGGKDRLGRGCDVIFDRYTVAPPSLHNSLTAYRWRGGASIAERTPAPLPRSLAKELASRPRLGWYLHNAPYAAADFLRLPLGLRQRLRRLARRAGLGT